MPLPVHLQRYDRLLDLVAETIVRELMAEMETPDGEQVRPGVVSTAQETTDNENSLTGYRDAAIDRT